MNTKFLGPSGRHRADDTLKKTRAREPITGVRIINIHNTPSREPITGVPVRIINIDNTPEYLFPCLFLELAKALFVPNDLYLLMY